jgi:hypothetical protein
LLFADGSRVVRFRNGTEKETRPGGVSIVRFSNGDVKRSCVTPAADDGSGGGGGGGAAAAGTPVYDAYFYAGPGTLQTTYHAGGAGGRGFDVFEFPSGQLELHDAAAGTKEILFPSGEAKVVSLQ